MTEAGASCSPGKQKARHGAATKMQAQPEASLTLAGYRARAQGDKIGAAGNRSHAKCRLEDDFSTQIK